MVYSYTDVADEYYDSKAHPTCANFREMSRYFYKSILTRSFMQRLKRGRVMELGAGKSLILDQGKDVEIDFEVVILQDLSEEMLNHSHRLLRDNVVTIDGDARQLPADLPRLDAVFAFLCDPYNGPELWNQVARVLKPGGLWIATTPSHDWSTGFRPPSHRHEAEFVRGDGSILNLPSFTFPHAVLTSALEQLGFRLLVYSGILIDEICGPISPKLKGSLKAPVLDCFVFERLGSEFPRAQVRARRES